MLTEFRSRVRFLFFFVNASSGEETTMSGSNVAVNYEESYVWEKHYPPGIEWNINIEAAPLFSILDQAVKEFPDRPAVSFAGQTITYAALGVLVSKIAAGLQKLGVKKEPRSVCSCPTRPIRWRFTMASSRLAAPL